MNKLWHTNNRMPKNATLAQRVKWHMSHAKHCHCREMPASIKAEIQKQKNK